MSDSFYSSNREILKDTKHYQMGTSASRFVEPTQISPTAGFRGLRNLGNTCYMNSALQCLLHLERFLEIFNNKNLNAEKNTSNKSGSQGLLLDAFCKLVSDMWSDGTSYISPSDFKRQLGRSNRIFANYNQQDAQEVLSCILDVLHEDLNRVTVKKYVEDPDIFEEQLRGGSSTMRRLADEAWNRHLARNQSKVQDLCHGLLYSIVQCCTCRHISARFDPFSMLSLPLPSNNESVSLKDTLRSFTEAELLKGDNQWYCSKCKDHRDAVKKMSVVRLPSLLILHFKRFSFNLRSGRCSKNAAEVEFDPKAPVNISPLLYSSSSTQNTNPSTPSLSNLNSDGVVELCNGGTKYQVVAALNHLGSTVDFGHYTAAVLHPFEDKPTWLLCDDERVSEISSNKVCSPNNYLLFLQAIPPASSNSSRPIATTSSSRHHAVDNEDFASEIDDEKSYRRYPYNSYSSASIPSHSTLQEEYLLSGSNKNKIHQSQYIPSTLPAYPISDSRPAPYASSDSDFNQSSSPPSSGTRLPPPPLSNNANNYVSKHHTDRSHAFVNTRNTHNNNNNINSIQLNGTTPTHTASQLYINYDFEERSPPHTGVPKHNQSLLRGSINSHDVNYNSSGARNQYAMPNNDPEISPAHSTNSSMINNVGVISDSYSFANVSNSRQYKDTSSSSPVFKAPVERSIYSYGLSAYNSSSLEGGYTSSTRPLSSDPNQFHGQYPSSIHSRSGGGPVKALHKVDMTLPYSASSVIRTQQLLPSSAYNSKYGNLVAQNQSRHRRYVEDSELEENRDRRSRSQAPDIKIHKASVNSNLYYQGRERSAMRTRGLGGGY